ncbi:MAG: hypothetical protein F4145_08350, partial [Boseongicola sp. SB0675_bin_26]|nr:hypothetical protein [Boseongicola sp. SB0675_bin_26]
MIRVFLLGGLALCIAPIAATAAANDTPPATTTNVATVEGITEYRLENGLRFLLFPDQSQQQMTVHQMVLNLDRARLIERIPGTPRSIRVLV